MDSATGSWNNQNVAEMAFDNSPWFVDQTGSTSTKDDSDNSYTWSCAIERNFDDVSENYDLEYGEDEKLEWQAGYKIFSSTSDTTADYKAVGTSSSTFFLGDGATSLLISSKYIL